MYNTIFFPTSGHVAQWVNSLLCPARNTFSVSDVSAEDHQTQTIVGAFGAAGFLVVFILQVETSRTKSSNTQRTEYKTTYVVIHQHSRKLLKMDILMSETCWAYNKWNKIASNIKLVFHSSTIAMMHGPINIRFTNNSYSLQNQRPRFRAASHHSVARHIY